ncbi:MAG TPA: sulfatase-like hydrolase/transferase [Limnochordia bacterium]|nr:sulfatase-like hydrolase/transferase [Limnochordia bacterium]
MPPARVARTPNVLVLMVDQMRADAMGCAGSTTVRTPELDELAARGVRFRNAYTPVPVCIAARHSLLTGLNCSVHGRHALNVPDPEPQLATLPQLLGLAGYTTHAIGKMHFRPVRRHFGFQRLQLMEEIPDYRQDDEYLQYLQAHGYGHVRWVHGVRSILYQLPQVSVLPEAHHGSTWVADRTIDFLAQNRNRPFFCFSSWIAPHPPWNAPEPYASLYDPEAMPASLGAGRDPATLPGCMRGNAQARAGLDEARLRRVKSLYYGNISLIDKGVGRILRALDALGLAENTLVIFTADHGEMLGDHGVMGKHLPYGGSARIPCLVRLPGRTEAGRVCDDPVSLHDIMPTVLNLAGITYPGDQALAGADLLAKPGGGLAEPRERLVVEYGRGARRWLMLREGPWRYTRYLADGWEELYHLERDPGELHNLLLDNPAGEERAVADRMGAYLAPWEAEHGFPPEAAEPPYDVERIRSTRDPLPNHSPRWVFRLPPEEAARLESKEDALRGAIAREPSVTMAYLAERGLLERY